jgi:3-hydroxyethyl bacteriochlorophyllide a dehydrogenase
MLTDAIVMEAPHRLDCRSIALDDPGEGDLVIAVTHSGISTGTEKLLYDGRMPTFPGMGYPLVPGYEAVGTVVDRRGTGHHRIGDAVFVPGAKCFGAMRALFGGAAQTLVVPEARVVSNAALDDARGVLLALAATAHHALAAPGATMPDLVVGHGTVGRLLARIAIAKRAPPPTVWEQNPVRRAGAVDYVVVDAADDPRRDYRAIYDCTGDAAIIDTLVGRLAKGGEIVLAGFYANRVAFDFAPAFMREARLRIAAEWQADDMAAVLDLIERGRLSFDGLITDHAPAADASAAYDRAFGAADCLKMVLDWSTS